MEQSTEFAPGAPWQRRVAAEHIDAVYDAMWPSTQYGPIQEAARAILTTEDDLAHQALAASLSDEVMMAELVKRGRLKVELTLGGSA